MIQFIRSLSELMVIIDLRKTEINISKEIEGDNLISCIGEQKCFIRSRYRKWINFAEFANTKSTKCIYIKDSLIRIIDNFQYNISLTN